METISGLTSILPVGSATSQSGNRGQQQLLSSQGQILKALVLETLGENRFTLEIGAEKITARSEAPLAAGQQLRLEVVKAAGPQIELKIVGDTLAQYLGKSVTLLGKNIDLGALVNALRQQPTAPLAQLSPVTRNTIEQFFSLQQNDLLGKEGGDVLKQLISNLGLNLENLLARGEKDAAVKTLKAALLDVAQKFAKAENISDTTNKLLTTIEVFQLAQLQLGNQAVFILPLPLAFIEQGYLLIENFKKNDSRDEQEPNESRFSLHLSLTDFGNLRIDFLRNQEGLFIRFHTDSKEKSEFLKTYGDELKSTISNTSVINISYSDDAKDPVGDLLRQLMPEGGSIFDAQA